MWQLPADDANYPLRWRIIKGLFSRQFEVNQQRSVSKVRKREKGIWQRRYWEPQIRDDLDLTHHNNYIHANPVKHGHVKMVKDWPYSSFHRFVREEKLPENWIGGESGQFEE